jgi:hypothetical protein
MLMYILVQGKIDTLYAKRLIVREMAFLCLISRDGIFIQLFFTEQHTGKEMRKEYEVCIFKQF